MLWGGPWTSRWGGNEEQIKRLELKEVIGGVRIRAAMIDGYTQFCKVVIDGINGPMKKVYDGDTLTEIIAPWPRPSGSVSPALTSHIISLVPMGDGALPNFDATFQQIFYTLMTPDRIAISITAVPSFFCYHSAGTITQLTSIALTGIKRFKNCKPVRNRKTWAKFLFTITSVGAFHTITLLVDGVAVASGSRNGNGPFEFVEENGSGINGPARITYSADVADGIMIARFPAQYKIHHRSSGAFGGGDFPRTAEQTINDDGRKSVFQWSGSVLAAGTRFVVIHQVDEDGNESNGTTNATIQIYTEPAAAGEPSYFSGSSLNTVIHFAASADITAFYNIYDSLATGILDMDATDNRLIHSEEFDNAIWIKSGGTAVTANQEQDPTGSNGADEIAFAGSNETIYQDSGANIATQVAVVFSIWLKATAPGVNVQLMLIGAASGQQIQQVELSTEWQRVFVTTPPKISTLVGNIRAQIRSLGADTIYAFGAQLERSGSLHPYRKTTAAVVTTTARLSHDVGLGTLSQALTALGAGFTGSRHIVVKSAYNGVESKAVKELTIEYVAGVRQNRTIPPAPSVTERLISVSGRTIHVPCSLLVIEQLAVATKIKLWITPVGTAVNFGLTPNGTVTLPSRIGKVVNATVSATALVNGAYNIAVRSETAGAVRSINTDEYGPFELTTALPSDPDVALRGGPA